MPTFQEYTSRSFGHKVNKSARLMSQRMAQLFKENGYNISIEQWRLLLYLWREDGVTQNFLAETTSKDEPSVSRIINTMEKNNLVIRARHPHDRRTNLIYLTESGRNVRDGLMAIGARMNNDITDGVDPDELTVCVKVLEKVLDNCNKLLGN